MEEKASLEQRENIYVRHSEIGGTGVFAKRYFKAGEIITHDLSKREELDIRTNEQFEPNSYLAKVAVQIGVGSDGEPLWVGIKEANLKSFLNHSCDPNSGLRLVKTNGVWDFQLVTLRQIQANTEITFDYSTWVDDGVWSMECNCCSLNCRGVISSFRDLPANLRQKYIGLDVVSPVVLKE